LGKIYQKLLRVREEKGAGFLVLLDPDEIPLAEIEHHAEMAEDGGVDGLLVGGSLLFSNNFDDFIAGLKKRTKLPVIIFPGSSRQVSPMADAILFLSLISSRNPNFIIGEQVLAAPIIRSMGLETISTGYVLIESGKITTVEYLSDSRPIPRDKLDIAAAHALAGEYLGMKLIYLEGGSGAKYSIPDEMIQYVSNLISVPLVVGGGIKTPEDAHRKVKAGASFVVIGNILEEHKDLTLIRDFSQAIHTA